MKKIILIVVVVLTFLIGCEVKNPIVEDETIPSVYVTYPANQQSISADQVNLSFDVTTDVKIDSIIVYLDGNKIATIIEKPYQFLISKNDDTPRTQTVYCKAFDKNGNVGISEINTFYWTKDEGLSDIKIDFIRPVLWEEFPTSDVNVQILIESEYAIDSVSVYVDGDVVYTFYDEPYEAVLQINNPGTHNIYAIAKDINQSSKTTGIINFSILLPDNEPPSGFITFPADWSDISGNLIVRITATDNVDVDRIELYIDGEYFDETSESPYNFSINSSNLGNGNHTIFAKIIDTSQLFSYSQMINIRVEN